MAENQDERQPDGASITLTPDMRQAGREPLPTPPPPRQRGNRFATLLGLLGLLSGLGGLAAAGWIYTDSKSELRRLASELAEVRVGLELYGRNAAAEAPAPATDTAANAELTDLADRLATLENTLRDTPPAAPAMAETTTPAAADTGDGDCLPSGMRILVAAGDTYPVCGQPGAVEVSIVDNGYIELADGTTIASGGNMPLPATACTIAVTSGGDEGTTGYAEIRVTC